MTKKTIVLILLIIATCCFPHMHGYSQTSDDVKYESAKKYFISGLGFYNNMQYLAAVEHFRKAVEIYPGFNRARDYLSRAYKMSGHLDAAIEELRNLADLSPDNVIVNNKINTLNFQQSGYLPDNSLEVIPYKTYKSTDFKIYSFTKPVDIVVDNEKNLYVSSFYTGKVIKIDVNGNGIVAEKPSGGEKIYGIDFHKDQLAVTDFTNDRIMILDKQLRTKYVFGKSGSAPGQMRGPEGVCFDNKGMLYVVDSGNNRVQKFHANGTFVQSFGSKGKYENQFNNPTDIASAGEYIYISDTGNSRVSCYDRYGNFVKHLLRSDLKRPRGLDVHNDNLVIADESQGLLIYNLKSARKKWIKKWKDDKNHNRYVSSATDRDGNIYCLDYNKSAIYVYTSVQNRYSNLVVDIASVDLNSFPTVAFYVNVRNIKGRPVYGLTGKNFFLTEDSARITNVYTEYLKKRPLSVSLAFTVDRSKTGRQYTDQMKWVADIILRQFNKNDSAKVVNFHENVWSSTDFDWSRRRALRAIGEKTGGKGKSIDTALYSSISNVAPRPNKRAVVLLTDGTVDDASFRTYKPDVIINYAKSHFVPVYIIAFNGKNQSLQRIARESGGRFIHASEMDKVKELYGMIKMSEEYRYVLLYKTYKPAAFQGLWTDVKLEVDYKGQKGVEWGGYFVPKAGN